MLTGKSVATGAGLSGGGSRMLASSSAVPARMTGLAEKAGGALGEAVAVGEEVLREREARAEGVGMGVTTVTVALGEMVGLGKRVRVDHGVASVTVALGEMEALRAVEAVLLRERERLVEGQWLTEGEPEGRALGLPVRETLGVRETERVALGECERLPVGLSVGDWEREGDSVVLRVPERVGEGLAQGEGVAVAHSEGGALRVGLGLGLRLTV